MSKTFSLGLSADQKTRLLRAVEIQRQNYNPDERMLRLPFKSPGYHTTLKGGSVHPTRESLFYAVALLDTGDQENFQTGLGIIERVIALQDTDDKSPTYGIWSWFMEEPLTQMSPPDWNWADFCGTQLLEAVLIHRSQMPTDLASRIDEAILHAARSIERRDVPPSYTNIAIMGSFVTLAAAELLELADLRAYGLGKLRKFFEFTNHHGAFCEYNSPTYTVVALNELLRLHRYISDPEAGEMVTSLYRLAWEEIALHFHAPTRQWAGPHSRCYHTLLVPEVLGVIQRATAGRFQTSETEPGIEEHRLDHRCPADLEHHFFEVSKCREYRETFNRDAPETVGTTWLTPELTLASINRGDLWNQRRALLAYWGTPEAPKYLHLRFLHDGYDFSAAMFFSVQKQGLVLAGISFATDGGDTHISLDMIENATIRASDIRLRFEFGGLEPEIPLEAPEELTSPVNIHCAGVSLQLSVPFAQWDGDDGRWEAGGDQHGIRWLDVVFYSGSERVFNLEEFKTTCCALAVNLSNHHSECIQADARINDSGLDVSAGELQFTIPSAPAPMKQGAGTS